MPIQTQPHDESIHVYNKMWSIFDQRTATEQAAHAVPYIRPNFRILDVGCGRGSISMDFARMVPEGCVLAVDVNPTLIEAGRRFAEEREIKNIEFRVLDATTELHTLEAESFDVVHEHQVLLYLPGRVHIVKEFRRLLRLGGFLSMRDNAWQSLRGLPPMMHTLIQHGLDYVDEQRGGGGPIGACLNTLAHAGGFRWDQIEASTWGWEVAPKDRPAWAIGCKGPRQKLLELGKMTDEELDQAAKECDEWAVDPAARWQGADGAAICWR